MRGIRSPDCALNVSHVLSRVAEHGSIPTALSEGEPKFAHPRLLFILKALCQGEGLTTVSFYRPTCSPALDRRALRRAHERKSMVYDAATREAEPIMRLLADDGRTGRTKVDDLAENKRQVRIVEMLSK